MARLAKSGLTQALPSLTLVPPFVAAYAYRRQSRETLNAISDPWRGLWPWSVTKVLKTSRLPNNFVGALSAQFRLTVPDGTPLSTNLWKRGGVLLLLGRLTAEVTPVPRLAELTLLGVDQDTG